MYQLMTTACILIDDIQTGVNTLCRTIGLLEQRPAAYQSGPGISAVFCRVHPKYAVAPTFLELTAVGREDQAATVPSVLQGQADPENAAVFPARQVWERQGDREIKWHATEIAMTDAQMRELEGHLASLGVAPGYYPPDRRDRFYIAGNPASPDFDLAVDAGMFIEATKGSDLGLPDEAFDAPADIPADAQPETIVRLVAREYLVRDVDTTVAALKRSLRWTPISITEEVGCLRAVMPFSAPRSARLELVQPTGPGRVANAFERLGPGAWTVRLSVVDPEAKAKDLAERGTPYALEDGVLRPDPAFTLQVPFEFIAA